VAKNKDIDKWRGLKSLVHDAVDATTELVREGHESTARSIRRVTDEIEPIKGPAESVDEIRRRATDGLLSSVKVVNRAVQKVTDLGLDAVQDSLPPAEAKPAVPLRSDTMKTAPWLADAALGVVNAALGDHLAASENALDLSMEFRIDDHYVPLTKEALQAALPNPSAKVALFVHGLATTEWCWVLEAEAYHDDPTVTFGRLLQKDLGFTPIYVRYNGGRKVAENGRMLCDHLQDLVDAYPVPIEDLTLIGHSMGGLVARSAGHYATESGHSWPSLVRRAFYLGSPHQGAPLAKLGHALTGALQAVDLPATRITSKILGGRSAGIKDLSEGDIVDETWLHPDPAARKETTTLLPTARHYFFSATVSKDANNPMGQLIGDLLVRVPSASGPELKEHQFDIETQGYGGVMHHQLQNHPAVYAQIKRACSGDVSA